MIMRYSELWPAYNNYAYNERGMIHIRDKSRYVSIVASLYFLLRFIGCFFQTSIYYIILFTFIEALPLLLIPRVLRIKAKYLLLCGFFLFFIVIPVMIRSSNFISEIAFTMLAIYLGYSLSKYGMNRRCAVSLYVVITSVLIYRLLSTGSIDSVFVVTSRNNISSFAILPAVLVYSTYNKNDNIPYIPAVVTFVLACIGEGRGGVLSSLFLLLGVLYINVFKCKRMIVRKVLSLFVLLMGVIVVFSVFGNVFFSGAIARLSSQRLLDNERITIIQQYISIARGNVMYILLGVPSDAIQIVAYLNGNFHNSFLSLHSLFGLGGVVTIVYLLLKSIHSNMKNRNLLVLVLLFTVVMRIFTDGLCFVGYYDPLLYFLLFLSVKTTSSNMRIMATARLD